MVVQPKGPSLTWAWQPSGRARWSMSVRPPLAQSIEVVDRAAAGGGVAAGPGAAAVGGDQRRDVDPRWPGAVAPQMRPAVVVEHDEHGVRVAPGAARRRWGGCRRWRWWRPHPRRVRVDQALMVTRTVTGSPRWVPRVPVSSSTRAIASNASWLRCAWCGCRARRRRPTPRGRRRPRFRWANAGRSGRSCRGGPISPGRRRPSPGRSGQVR